MAKQIIHEPEELVLTLDHGSGVTRVWRPILSDEERERRFEAFKAAVARFLADID